MLGLMGVTLQKAAGNKVVYWLYGLGSLFSGASSSFFGPQSPYIQPKLGPEGVIAAYITFLAMMNPHASFMVFFFPMKAWVLIFLLGSYSLLFDPHKRSFAGITAGLTVFNMRRVGFI
jgi:membrane associated rhomboid family serine protease